MPHNSVQRRQASVAVHRVSGGPDPGGTGDAGLEFDACDGGNEEPFAVLTYPCRQRARTDRTFGRRIGRDDVGVEQIQAEPPHG